MKKLLLGAAALPFLAGSAMAGQPVPLTASQMDQVTAGLEAIFFFAGNGNLTGFSSNTGASGGTPSTNYVSVSFPTLDGAQIGFPSVTVSLTSTGPVGMGLTIHP